MKKILIIITLTLCIFQMVVLATAIDIGSAAIDRGSALDYSNTLVEKANPANVTGTITNIEIWANINMPDCDVATFFVVSGNNLSTRDTHNIGAVTAGSKQTFSGLSLDVHAGDYIGIQFTNNGQIESESSGGTGMWYLAGDHVPCTDTTFNYTAGYTFSLYATGISSAEEDNAIFMGANF